MSRVLIPSLCAALLAHFASIGLAHAEAAPHLGWALGQTAERLEVPGPDGQLAEARDLLSSRFIIGLDYDLLGADQPVAGGRLIGRSALATDVLFGPGRWGLGAEQSARWVRPLAGSLALDVGLALSARLDLDHTARSQLDIGLPLGLRWAMVHVEWQPSWRVPLGADEAEVFGGTRRQSIDSGLSLLAFGVRIQLDALSW